MSGPSGRRKADYDDRLDGLEARFEEVVDKIITRLDRLESILDQAIGMVSFVKFFGISTLIALGVIIVKLLTSK